MRHTLGEEYRINLPVDWRGAVAAVVDTLDEGGYKPLEDILYRVTPQDVVDVVETRFHNIEADFDWCPGVGRGMRTFVQVVHDSVK